jgi:hypothetical protein
MGGGKQKKNPCKQKVFEKKYMQTNLFKKKLQTTTIELSF